MGVEICFDDYLRSIVNTHQKWEEWYTPTDATGKDSLQVERDRPAFFDFGLMVQTVDKEKVESQKEKGEEEKKEKGEEEKKEKIERLPVLEGICKYAAEHVLLVGRPGSGKSTALARLLLQEAENALSDRNAKIPVLVELRYLPSEANASSVCDRILAFMHKHDPALDIDEAGIKQLLRQGRLLLLVDGVNELPSDRGRVMVNQFRELYQKTCPMIFTTRELSAGGDLGIAKRLEMQPLTEPQMQQFVMAYLPTQGERLLRQLSGRLREFGQTPLLLWMLCSLFQQSEQIPPNLGMVFRAFTVGYGDRIKQDVTLSKDSRAWWGRLLQYLAFKMTCGESLTELQVAISRREAEQFLVEFLRGKVEFADDCAVRWLEDLLKHHLIQISNDRIEFRHQLIQEYYAAEWLLGLLPSLSDARLQHDYLNYLKWTEPLALMLELVEGEEQAVRVVRLALEVDLRLGARLAGAVKDKFQEKTVRLLIQEIEKQKIPQEYAIKLLGKTRSDYAINPLVKSFKDKDYSGIPTDALGFIGSNKALEILISIVSVHSYNSYIRMSAIKALGDISNTKAVEALIATIHDDDSDVRRYIVETLGKIGNERAIKALITVLHDDDSDVRRYVVEALGEIGNEQTIQALITSLTNSDYSIHLDTIIVLMKIGNEKAIKSFIAFFRDCNYITRLDAVMRLGKICNKNVVDPLIVALKDSDRRIRVHAINALERIGNDKAIDALINLLNDSDTVIRWNAAKALGEIGNEKAAEALINLLNDSENIVVRYVSDAISKIGNEKAAEALIKAFNDSNGIPFFSSNALTIISHKKGIEFLVDALKHHKLDIRMIAAEALGKIGNAKTIDALIESLNTPDVNVRRSAVKALGKTGNNKAVDYLIKSLNDSEGMIYWNAVEALGEIGDEKAVAPMIHIFNNSEFVVQHSIIDALGKIGNDTSINYLIGILENDNIDLRRTVVKALGKIGNKKAITALIKALNYPINAVAFLAAEILQKLSQSESNLPILAKSLPHLLKLIATKSSQEALSVITAIQARCKYYNYDIAQTPLPPEDKPNPTTGNSYIFKAPLGQVVENLTVQRDNIATQNNQKTSPES